jgi:hypothetical protein
VSSKTIEVSKAVVKLCRKQEVYDFLGLIAFSVLEMYLDHLLCLLYSYRAGKSDGRLCSWKLHLLAAAERATADWNYLFHSAYRNVRTGTMCIYIYIQTYIHTREHTSDVQIHTHMFITYIRTHIHTYIHTHIIHTYIHTYIRTYIYTLHKYLRTHINTIIHMYVHT